MAEKKEIIYPKGLRTFDKNENAPDFVLGSLIVTPRELTDWITENSQYLSDYKGAKQLKLNMLKGDKGVYFTVDTWKANSEAKAEPKAKEALPADDTQLPF